MHRSGTRLFRRFQDSSPSRHTHENLSRLQWRWCRDMDDELIVTAHGNESQHPVAASGGGALGAPPLGFFQPESDTSISCETGSRHGNSTFLEHCPNSGRSICVLEFTQRTLNKESPHRVLCNLDFCLGGCDGGFGHECHKCPSYDLLVAHSDLAFALEV